MSGPWSAKHLGQGVEHLLGGAVGILSPRIGCCVILLQCVCRSLRPSKCPSASKLWGVMRDRAHSMETLVTSCMMLQKHQPVCIGQQAMV